MSYQPPQISRDRLDAVTAALGRLSGHWPRAFPWLHDASQHAASLRSDYARATLGAPVHVIADAAERWIATEKFAPKAAELGAVARSLAPTVEASYDPTEHPAWLWESPVSGRIVHVVQRPDGWVSSQSLDDAESWAAMTNHERYDHANQMATRHPLKHPS